MSRVRAPSPALEAEYDRVRRRTAEYGGERQRTAENGRERQRTAENGRERRRTAENGGERQFTTPPFSCAFFPSFSYWASRPRLRRSMPISRRGSRITTRAAGPRGMRSSPASRRP